MKHLMAIAMIFILACSLASAEEYANMSIDELESYRNALLEELSLVNDAIASRKTESGTAMSEISEATIAELFPDESFALCVRDKLGKLSINDTVTQNELDDITWLSVTYSYKITDLTGISHLRNLEGLSLNPFESDTISDEVSTLAHLHYLFLSNYRGSVLPNWFTQMTQLDHIEFPASSITSLPEDFGNLINMKNIMLNNSTKLSSIPDSIGQCVMLEELHLGNTGISSIPDSLGKCVNLKNLEVSYTSISELPQSVLDLGIEKIDISSTNIK